MAAGTYADMLDGADGAVCRCKTCKQQETKGHIHTEPQTVNIAVHFHEHNTGAAAGIYTGVFRR